MRPELRRKQSNQAPKQTNALSDVVVPKLLQTITALREEVAKLKAELQRIQLATVRTEAKRIVYRNGIEQQ